MKPGHADLGRSLLDAQIYDVDHLECGKVDEIELLIEDGAMRVTSIRTGPGVAARRLPGPLSRLALRILGGASTRIPWQEVEIVEDRVKLRIQARERGLGKADRAAARWIRPLPLSGKGDEA